MLSIDALIASGVILQFVGDFNTAAYAVFAYIIAEAAIRFELIGSLSALVFFILGLYGAFVYRKAAFGVPFSYTGFAYWTVLMTVLAVSTGIVVRVVKTSVSKTNVTSLRLRECWNDNALPTKSSIRYLALCYGVPVRILRDDSLVEEGMDKVPDAVHDLG
jgi:hypothetical protein